MAAKRATITSFPRSVKVEAGGVVLRIRRATEDQLFLAVMEDCIGRYPGIDLDRPGIFDSMENLRAAIADAGLLDDTSPEDQAEALAELPPATAVGQMVEMAADGGDSPYQPARYRMLPPA